MYVEIGRPCDAITPLEMYLRYDVAARQTAQIAQLISEWATQGNCRASHAAGSDKVFLAPDNIIDVVVKRRPCAYGSRHTGAGRIVSMTPSFASRSKDRYRRAKYDDNRRGWNAGRLWLWLELMDDNSVHRGAWLPAVHDDQAALSALERLWSQMRPSLSA